MLREPEPALAGISLSREGAVYGKQPYNRAGVSDLEVF